MKKIHFILLFIVIFTISWGAYSQPVDPNIKLPLDQKLALYFDTFRDGSTRREPSIFAGSIVIEFNVEVIPYLKEYIKDIEEYGHPDFLHGNDCFQVNQQPRRRAIACMAGRGYLTLNTNKAIL